MTTELNACINADWSYANTEVVSKRNRGIIFFITKWPWSDYKVLLLLKF